MGDPEHERKVDEPRQEEGLPTAALFKFYPSEEPLEKRLELTEWADNHIKRNEDPIELVRRTDVAQLIEDKIEDLHELNREFQEEHRDIPYPVHDHIEQIKEQLLEEVQRE